MMIGIFLEEMINVGDAAIGGGVLTAIIAVGFLAVFLFSASVYVYFALAWMTIAKKLNYKYPWLAWVPFANIALILQLGEFHWAWVFLIAPLVIGAPLMLIVIGIPLFFMGIFTSLALFVLTTIATWRIFEKLNYSGWLALIPVAMIVPYVNFVALVGYVIVIGFVAWGKENSITQIKKIPVKKVSRRRK